MNPFDRILALIRQNFPSDTSFEAKMGLKPKTVDSWKRGKSKSYLKMLPELAQLFGVSADYLLGREPGDDEDNPYFQLSAPYLSLAKKAQDNGLDPRDIDEMMNVILRVKRKQDEEREEKIQPLK